MSKLYLKCNRGDYNNGKNNLSFSKEEISRVLKYMMINELYLVQKNDGKISNN